MSGISRRSPDLWTEPPPPPGDQLPPRPLRPSHPPAYSPPLSPRMPKKPKSKIQKAKEGISGKKIVEDKTFGGLASQMSPCSPRPLMKLAAAGMKNKNKSKKVQKFIAKCAPGLVAQH